MRQVCKCPTASQLPRGLKCDRGYLVLRVKHNGAWAPGIGCGPHTRELEKVATLKLNEIRAQQYLKTYKIPQRAERLKFREVRVLFHNRHYVEYKDPSTLAPRTERSINNALSLLRLLGKTFDSWWFDAIEGNHLEAHLSRRLKTGIGPATYNKELDMMKQIYTQMTRWVTLKKIRPVLLPAADPTASLSSLTEHGRKRIPDTFELADVYSWCQANDPSFWNAIRSALLTALRKQDLVALDGSLTVKGIQQKTGEKFDLPLTLSHPVDYTPAVFRRKWSKVRTYLNWHEQAIEGHTKPHRHTTWHDLRHWAPTMLGEKGFSGKIIQNYLGHSNEATSERYTNIRQKALLPATEAIEAELQEVEKASSVKSSVKDN